MDKTYEYYRWNVRADKFFRKSGEPGRVMIELLNDWGFWSLSAWSDGNPIDGYFDQKGFEASHTALTDDEVPASVKA